MKSTTGLSIRVAATHRQSYELVEDMKSTRKHMDPVMLQEVEMAQRVVEGTETAAGTDDCFIADQTKSDGVQ